MPHRTTVLRGLHLWQCSNSWVFPDFFFFESYKKPAPCASPGRISGTEYILKLATEMHTGRAFVVMLLMAAAVLTSTV